MELAGVDAELRVDPDRVRAVEVPELRGDPTKLVRATGWGREHTLDQTLRDVLAGWRAELARAG
jgi:GDP-D-mannose dehydratase